MLKNLDTCLQPVSRAGRLAIPRPTAPDQAQRMRRHLTVFLERMAAGTQPLRLPSPATEWVPRGDGHFHHDWLADAARLGRSAQAGADPRPEESALAAAQSRALVLAATAGVLRVLDDAAADTRPEPPLVAHVRVFIQNQLGDDQLSVRRLAEQAGCTADYLSHVFRLTTGEHLAAYIQRQRMVRAARLLRETTLAGKEVAWACGFATQSYFIRTFREHFDMTPKAWRAGRAEGELPGNP